MPELPEVETVRRGLEPTVKGARIVRAQARRLDLRFPLPEGFGQSLTGQRVVALERRAKYLLWHLDGGTTLISHLGMSGRYRIYSGDVFPPLEKHDHVIFSFDGAEVRYNDPRRFGFMDLVETKALADSPFLKDLGPEPLSDDFSAVGFQAMARTKSSPIKSVLLDQGVVAGLGNIYVCEALFRSGIHPKTKAQRISAKRLEKLVAACKDVLREAIAAGGSSLRDHRQPSGELGYFQHGFQAYGREGEACQKPGCSGTIGRMVQSGRSSFYCKSCQR